MQRSSMVYGVSRNLLCAAAMVVMTTGGALAGSDVPSLAANDSANDMQTRTAVAAEASHGELLYENHCTSCHTSIAHRRDNRKAQSATEVNAWVRRWATELNLGWSPNDVEDVTRYLVKRFYRFESRTGQAPDASSSQTAQIAPSIGCPE